MGESGYNKRITRRGILRGMIAGVAGLAAAHFVGTKKAEAGSFDGFPYTEHDYEWPLLKDVPDMSDRFSEKDWLNKGASSLLVPIGLERYIVYNGYLPSEDLSSIKRYVQVVWLTRHGALCGDELNIFVRPRPQDYLGYNVPVPPDYGIAIGGTGLRGKPATGIQRCVYEGNWASWKEIERDGTGHCDLSVLDVKSEMFVGLPDFYSCEPSLGFKVCWEMFPERKPESWLNLEVQYDPNCKLVVYRERISIGNRPDKDEHGYGHGLVPMKSDWLITYTTPNEWPHAALRDFRSNP